MQVIIINVNSVSYIDNGINKAFGSEFIRAVGENSACGIPFNACFVINRHIFCEYVKPVAAGDSSRVIGGMAEAFHILDKLTVVAEILLNGNNIKTV